MKRLISIISLVMAGLLLVFISGCKSNSDGPTSPDNNNPSPNQSGNLFTIAMAGNTFSPSPLTVPLHSTITWNNNSPIAHTSTSDTGVWDTGNIPAGDTSTTTFDVAGTYHYHCIYHSGMVGAIIVQ